MEAQILVRYACNNQVCLISSEPLSKEVQTRTTICETGIHIKRSVAVHPEIAPTNLTPFSESLPVRACKFWQNKF